MPRETSLAQFPHGYIPEYPRWMTSDWLIKDEYHRDVTDCLLKTFGAWASFSMCMRMMSSTSTKGCMFIGTLFAAMHLNGTWPIPEGGSGADDECFGRNGAA
jgi:hypothetical protein